MMMTDREKLVLAILRLCELRVAQHRADCPTKIDRLESDIESQRRYIAHLAETVTSLSPEPVPQETAH